MSTVGIQYAVDQTASRLPTATVPAGSGVPTFYQPCGSVSTDHDTVLPSDSRIPDRTVTSGPEGSSFYQPLSSAYPSPYGLQPVGTVQGVGSMAEGRPVVVSGSSCPLCGGLDYHVHPDSVVVNATTNFRSGAAPTAAASSTTLPVAGTLGQSTFLAGCELFDLICLFLAHSMSLCNREASVVRRLSVRL